MARANLKKLGNKIEFSTHVLAIHADWDLKSTWKMVKPYLYEEDGKLKCRPLDRVPDGEVERWELVLVRDDKSYHRVGDEDCNCDLSSGDMCVHWREIR